jgi:hypothetical protein
VGYVSGFAVLAAIALTSLLILWANIIILEGDYLNQTTQVESAIQRIKMDERRLKEAYTLAIVGKSQQKISARVANTGTIPLPVNTFTQCDVIITFYDLNAGGYTSYWLRYNPQGGAGYWYVGGVYTGGTSGEGINPFDLTTSSGHLDPGESMLVIATLPSGSVLDVNRASAMLFATASGVRAVGVG